MKGARLLETLAQKFVANGIGLATATQRVRWAIINVTLKKHNGNQCRAARELHLHRNSLAREIANMRLANFPVAIPKHRQWPRREASLSKAPQQAASPLLSKAPQQAASPQPMAGAQVINGHAHRHMQIQFGNRAARP